MASNIIEIKDLGEKHPSEIIKFWFDLTGNTAFQGSSAETIDENATWRVVTTSDTSTDLSSSMVNTSDYDNTLKRIAVEIQAGTDGISYYVIGLLQVASDRKYVVAGKLLVTDHGIDVSF